MLVLLEVSVDSARTTSFCKTWWMVGRDGSHAQQTPPLAIVLQLLRVCLMCTPECEPQPGAQGGERRWSAWPPRERRQWGGKRAAFSARCVGGNGYVPETVTCWSTEHFPLPCFPFFALILPYSCRGTFARPRTGVGHAHSKKYRLLYALMPSLHVSWASWVCASSAHGAGTVASLEGAAAYYGMGSKDDYFMSCS